MTDLYDRIVAQRSGVEEFLAKIPGYKGYKEASDRRSADRMVREHIVNELKKEMTRLQDVERKILNAGGLMMASATTEARMKFQLFIDKVNTAAPGYSGFFDAKKVGEAELEKLYAFDAALIAYVNKFNEAINTLEKAVGDNALVKQAVNDLEAVANESLQAYSLRDNVITDIR